MREHFVLTVFGTWHALALEGLPTLIQDTRIHKGFLPWSDRRFCIIQWFRLGVEGPLTAYQRKVGNSQRTGHSSNSLQLWLLNHCWIPFVGPEGKLCLQSSAGAIEREEGKVFLEVLSAHQELLESALCYLPLHTNTNIHNTTPYTHRHMAYSCSLAMFLHGGWD